MIQKLVTCCTCTRTLPEQQSVSGQLMRAIDGNLENLKPENIQMTGENYHQCLVCCYLECLDSSPLFATSKRFQAGYDIGMREARHAWGIQDTLTDSEIIHSLKGIFAEYAAEHNEEVLAYRVGSSVGLLVGLAVVPVLDACKEQEIGAEDRVKTPRAIAIGLIPSDAQLWLEKHGVEDDGVIFELPDTAIVERGQTGQYRISWVDEPGVYVEIRQGLDLDETSAKLRTR